MKIAVLGTGLVGRTLAAKLHHLGHDIVVGTRDPHATMSRLDQDGLAEQPYSQWQSQNPGVPLATAREAAAAADIVVNATNGANAVAALEAVGGEALYGKIVLDLALPLDFSRGMPPILTVSNTDSLGEQIQRKFPDVRVVKSLTTVFCAVMVEPTKIEGQHDIFIAGNDEQAKSVVKEILTQFGWAPDSILDLGDITGARAVEMYSRLFFTLAKKFGTFEFNISVVRP